MYFRHFIMLRRILILTNRVPYPLHDGGALAMDAMIRGYRDAGIEVALLAMNTSRHPVPPATLKTLYTDLALFETVETDNRIRPLKLIANFLFSHQPEHVQRFSDPHFAEKLSAILKDFRPDAVQVESLFLTQYLPVIKARSSAITMLRLHNIEHEIWQRLADESRGAKHFYLRNLARRMQRYEQEVWQQYDLLLPITEKDASAVCKATFRDLLTIPFGIDTNGLKTALPVRFNTGYHLGGMDWLPNVAAIRWFIDEAWPVLHKAVPDFTFHFAGRYMPEHLEKRLPEGIVCDGAVPDAAAFIADKDVLIVPLRSGGGIRVKILEAMAAGKLVISTTIGMQGIEAENGVHYLQADTSEAFATAVSFACKNPSEAAAIAHSGTNMVLEKYAQQEIMRRLIDKVSAMTGNQ